MRVELVEKAVCESPERYDMIESVGLEESLRRERKRINTIWHLAYRSKVAMTCNSDVGWISFVLN